VIERRIWSLPELMRLVEVYLFSSHLRALTNKIVLGRIFAERGEEIAALGQVEGDLLRLRELCIQHELRMTDKLIGSVVQSVKLTDERGHHRFRRP
jgi:hypothetical protein